LVRLEGDGGVNNSVPKEIRFDFHVGGSGQDGVDFRIPDTPLVSGCYPVNVMVEGTALATQTGLPQRFIVPYTRNIKH
jgi:hypothetical protein